MKKSDFGWKMRVKMLVKVIPLVVTLLIIGVSVAVAQHTVQICVDEHELPAVEKMVNKVVDVNKNTVIAEINDEQLKRFGDDAIIVDAFNEANEEQADGCAVGYNVFTIQSYTLECSESIKTYTTSGATTTHQFSSTGSGVSYLKVGIRGDYNANSEYADIYIEGDYIGRINPGSGWQCNPAWYNVTFWLNSTQTAKYTADGVVQITITNSYAVGTFCTYNQHLTIFCSNVDENSDDDGDGLTLYQEVEIYGTNPTKADTDGDGLNDGDEVNIYGTNPTKADTDGDGAGDGTEILLGYDPLDPASSPYIRVSNDMNVSDQPDIAYDSSGNAHIVWMNEPTWWGGYSDIYYKMLDANGKTLIDVTPLTSSPQNYSVRPAVAVDSDGMVHVIWQDTWQWWGLGPFLFYTKINPYADDRDGDSASKAAITVVQDKRITPDLCSEPRVAVDSQDNLHVVCEAWKQVGWNWNLWIYYLKLDKNGNVLIPQTPIATPSCSWRTQPDVAVDSNDNVHIIWNDCSSTCTYELHYTMLDNNGNVLIYNTTVTADDCSTSNRQSIELTPDNKAVLVWQDFRLGNVEVFYKVIDPYADDRDGDSANLAVITVVDDTVISPVDGTKSNQPWAEVDPNGILHVTWYDNKGTFGANSDLYYATLDPLTGNFVIQPTLISPTATTSRAWTNAYMDSGSLGVVWCDNGTGYFDIFYAMFGVPNQPPVIRYHITPMQALPGQQVVFDASDSYDPDGDIVYIEWIFPDGVIPNSIAFKTFQEPGIYHVTIRAVDDDGAQSTLTIDYEVVGVPPVANFTYQPESPKAGELVTFNASPSYDPDGTIISYVWNFGDGFTDSGVIVNHTYSSSGTYTVTLTVMDNHGLTNTVSKEIQISENAVGVYTFSDLVFAINIMLSGEYNSKYDLNSDSTVDFEDLIAILNAITS
jgi:hypothetical protein